jgi:NADPH-dependent 2,4-dienoyl-CoA reductase/sulfur reductase-like enzyme
VHLKRRGFVGAAIVLGTAALLPRIGRPAVISRRVVVVGGGWGGLAAARYLRDFAPELDITLIERNASFWSCPLSNKWLVGMIDGALLTHDYAVAARAFGYRFVRAEVAAIDRDRHRVVTADESFPYDWLILAEGIRQDYAAWFGTDHETASLARKQFPTAYMPGAEFPVLREKLENFRGGDLLMNVPPAPFRCPPAPYERAVLLAGWLEARKIPGRIVILDPNPPFREFQRIFRERFPDRIIYHAQTPILSVDPRQRLVRTEFEDFSFAEAILMPPQQAGDLAWQADLIGRDESGRPTGWAAVDPLTFAAHNDAHIYMIGDMIDRVSGLFGHYPKTGQMAVRQGRSVARQIAARARDMTAPTEFPDSLCLITTSYAPPEAIRIDANYRLRGDGEIAQQTKTERDAQPRGEDLAWARSLFAEILAAQ